MFWLPRTRQRGEVEEEEVVVVMVVVSPIPEDAQHWCCSPGLRQGLCDGAARGQGSAKDRDRLPTLLPSLSMELV